MPTETYSSGMRARLAFGACLAIQFDIYLIDEVTSVGDGRFRAKCLDAFRQRLEPAPEVASLERHAYYERARGAFAIVRTGERRPYGNFLLRKGVVS